MSIAGGVIGLDFGADTSIVSQAKRGGIDTVMNEASKRKTQSMVGFQGNERFIGAAAFPLSKSNYKNTVRSFKRLLGLSFDDPNAQMEIALMPNKDKFVALENGMVGVKVNYNDAEVIFSMEQVTAMLFNKLRASVNKADLPSDVVVSVPGWWNERQRRSLLQSCSIAGFSALRLLNDHTAAALSYGIYKSARNVFDAEEQQIVMFIDIGYSNMSVAIVGFVQGKLQVLSAAYDPYLGGRNFDDAIFDKCVNEFKEQHKLDVRTNPKAMLKLRQVCEKAKQTLTPEGVNEAKINCEYLMNEIDFKSQISLEEFATASEHLLARLKAPVEQALQDANVAKENIKAVEIIGGGTRPKIVKEALGKLMGLDATKQNYGLSTTLNSDESVARGCALNSAMLSPVFRVKEFNVCDVLALPVMLTWDQADTIQADASTEITSSSNSVVIVQKNQSIPCTKRVTFRRVQDFNVKAKYEFDDSVTVASFLPKDFDINFASFKVKVDNKKVENEPDKAPLIRVDFSVDNNGLFKLSSAEALHEKAPKQETPPEEESKASDKVDDKVKTESEKDKKEDSQKTESDDKKEDSKETEADNKKEGEAKESDEKKVDDSKAKQAEEDKKKPEKKKIKYRKVRLVTESTFKYGLSKEELNTLIEKEKEYTKADKLIEETSAVKNALEGYIYSYRDKIIGELKEFLTDVEREDFGKSLAEQGDWLYDDGYDESKEEYSKRLNGLKSVGDRFDVRKVEFEERPNSIKAINAAIASFTEVANSTDEKYDHITEEERSKVKDKVQETKDWLGKQCSGQDKLSKSDDPVLTVSLIKEKHEVLSRVCLPIVTKKKPPPPKPEKKEEKMEVEENEEDAAKKKDEEAKEEDKDETAEVPTEGMEVD